MKLAPTLNSLSVPLRASVQVLFTLTVLAGVASLELFGRMAASDVQDSLAALGLIGLVGLVVLWHRRRPLGWVSWLIARGADLLVRLKKWKYDHGFDFRGTPPLPRRVPPAVWWLALGVVLWSALAIAVWYLLPGGWREIGLKTSYVLYLITLVLVWTLLLGGLIGGMFLPLLLIDRRLRETLADLDRRKILFLCLLAYLFLLTAAASLLPAVVALALCVVSAVVAAVWAVRANDLGLAVLWRFHRDQQVYSVPVSRAIAVVSALGIAAFVALVLTGAGGRIWSRIEPTDAMPLTASLAALVAWTGPGLLAILGLRVWFSRRRDPAGSSPPGVYIRNSLSDVALENVKKSLADRGWKVRAGKDEPDDDDVKIELVHPERSEAREFEPTWPLKVTPADLDDPDVYDRLVRRDEIQMRRFLFRGLNRLLKRAAAVRGEKGGGFWLAPHWWFILGLGREDGGKSRRTEDGEGAVRRIGPPYNVVFGVRPRQHLYRMLQAVQVDVIFIEDGVPLKALVKVFRTMFDLYDRSAGKRIVDDHTFQGIPKVKVMVHEFSPLKEVTETGTYKQPKFDDLSRGRVLHVFRDRGGHEEFVEPPFDSSYEPSPLLMV